MSNRGLDLFMVISIIQCGLLFCGDEASDSAIFMSVPYV